MEKKDLSKLFSLILILFLFINLFSEKSTEYYKVKYGKYSGNGEITIDEQEDTIFIEYEVKLYWGLFKVQNKGAILKQGYKPKYLFTDIRALKKHNKGYSIYMDSISIYYSGKDSTIVHGKYPVNDWVLLPIYLKYMDADSLSFSLLQGDFTLKRSFLNDTILWKSDNNEMIVKIVDNITVYFNLKGHSFTRKK